MSLFSRSGNGNAVYRISVQDCNYLCCCVGKQPLCERKNLHHSLLAAEGNCTGTRVHALFNLLIDAEFSLLVFSCFSSQEGDSQGFGWLSRVDGKKKSRLESHFMVVLINTTLAEKCQ